MTISTTVSATMVQSWHVSFVFNARELAHDEVHLFGGFVRAHPPCRRAWMRAQNARWISSAMPWMRSTAPSSCSDPRPAPGWWAPRAWDEEMKAVFCISRSPLASYAPRCDAACSSASIFAARLNATSLWRTRRRAWPCRRRPCVGSAPRRRCAGRPAARSTYSTVKARSLIGPRWSLTSLATAFLAS